MQANINLNRLIAIPLTVAMIFFTMPYHWAQAGIIGTDALLNQEQRPTSDRDQVTAYLARQEVQNQLSAWGVDPAEATERVRSMSDSNLTMLAKGIANEPAGQGAVGGIIGAFVLVFLVLLFTDIVGFTNVFNFTR
ncbi:MAG: PA2779 family protein [Magnetococcales bacterium]|nr:PA2779 family protein [Magnetococcales bacterium]